MSPSPSNKILSPMTKCLGIAMHFILKYIYQIVVRFRMVTFLILMIAPVLYSVLMVLVTHRSVLLGYNGEIVSWFVTYHKMLDVPLNRVRKILWANVECCLILQEKVPTLYLLLFIRIPS